MDDEYARDAACSVILQALDVAPFACLMAHQNDPRRMKKLLHQRHSANTTFSKGDATFYSSSNTIYRSSDAELRREVGKDERTAGLYERSHRRGASFHDVHRELPGSVELAVPNCSLCAVDERQSHLADYSRLLQEFDSQQGTRKIG